MGFVNVYHGEVLEVDAVIHESLGLLFPEVDRYSEYRSADAWLWAAPKSKRPRNIKKFLRNWFEKSKQKESGAEYVMEQGVKCRVTSADRRTGRV